MPTSHSYLRRATTSVLVAVALISGAILLLGDRFDPVPGYALSQPVHAEGHIAACVADESMRLINPEQERCRPGELKLASDTSLIGTPGVSGSPGPTGPPGPSGRPGADGVSGFEIVTAKVSVPGRQSAEGQVRCPAGKVAVGGGVLPDEDTPRRGGEAKEHMEIAVSAPLLPGPDAGGYGWTATVRNTGTAPLSVFVAAICLKLG